MVSNRKKEKIEGKSAARKQAISNFKKVRGQFIKLRVRKIFINIMKMYNDKLADLNFSNPCNLV